MRPLLLYSVNMSRMNHQSISFMRCMRNVDSSCSVRSNSDHSARSLIASLPPLKRIICLCPVPITNDRDCINNSEYDKFSIGMAVSDPYLAYGIPLESANKYALTISDVFGNAMDDLHGQHIHTAWDGLPKSTEEFANQVGYNDIGASIVTFPLNRDFSKSALCDIDDIKMDQIHNAIKCKLGNLMKKKNNLKRIPAHTDHECVLVQHRLDIDKARDMAIEEPEMWDEISLDDDCLQTEPNMHAAASLNTFLWEHTGGWRNTFA